MVNELGVRNGRCLRHGCPGHVRFDGSGSHNLPGQQETEPAWCSSPACRLRHERDVNTGLVSARWYDDDMTLTPTPDFDEGYYLR